MRVPLKSFSVTTDENGLVSITIDGQVPNMDLIQKLELVIDACDMVPFVRLTAITGKLGVTLGNTELEIKPGDPNKPTFGRDFSPGQPVTVRPGDIFGRCVRPETPGPQQG